MRKFVCLLLLSTCFFVTKAQISSISQLKDVKSTDKYYPSLRSLVERWGVIGNEEIEQGNNYLGKKGLTRKAFTYVMSRVLDRINDLLEIALENSVRSDTDSLTKQFRKKRMKGYNDAGVLKISAVSQYKDVSPADPFYKSLQNMVEKHAMVLGSAGNQFQSIKTLTHADLQRIFSGFFGVSDIIKPSSKELTRGEWAIYLDQLLEFLENDLASTLSGK